jgi:probable H4MPT-linked C1 transfer pathway protein
MPVLGLDIGGANLKAAHTAGGARTQPFALWKDTSWLPTALRELLHGWPPYDLLAVTMTGELCDCFASKRQGVEAILAAVTASAGGKPVLVWLTDGRFVDVAEARNAPLRAAASNWLALAVFAGRLAPQGPALLIDVGSTTTDIVPLIDGQPKSRGRTDPERLRCGELVYSGVRRTPLCALLGGFGAAELFATTLDVYLTLGQVPEDPLDCDTADGRPATRAAAAARLARMICADLETSTEEEQHEIALRAAQQQVRLLLHALDSVTARLPGPPETVILSGSGEYLGRVVWQAQKHCPPCPVVSLDERLGPEISRAACAHAVAVLAAEGITVS